MTARITRESRDVVGSPWPLLALLSNETPAAVIGAEKLVPADAARVVVWTAVSRIAAVSAGCAAVIGGSERVAGGNNIDGRTHARNRSVDGIVIILRPAAAERRNGIVVAAKDVVA